LLQTELHGLSVSLSVTIVSPAKMAEAIEIPFGVRTLVGIGTMYEMEVQIPPWKEQF